VELPRPPLPRLVVAALAVFMAFAAIAPAAIDTTQGQTFSATAGQEFNGKVAEFHAQGKDPDPGEFSAKIFWGDNQPKSDGTVTLKAGDQTGGTFNVTGKHTYSVGGKCAVKVEVTQNTQVVTVNSTANVAGPPTPNCGSNGEPPPDPPKAGISEPPVKPRQGYVTLIGSSSKPGSATIVKYHWDFGDGQLKDLPQGSGTADHIFNKPGQYVVKLTVTDSNGLTSTIAKKIDVLGSPKAVITYSPKKGKADTEFTMRGNKSSVDGGKIVRWQWKCFGKKLVEFDSDAPGMKTPKDRVKCRFENLKNAWAELTVWSDEGAKATESTTMPVKPKFAPKASFDLAPDDPEQGQEVQFDASNSASNPLGDGADGDPSDPDGIQDYFWEWGDGTWEHTKDPTVTHTYTGEPGKRLMTLTVTDAEGTNSIQNVLWVTSKCFNDMDVRGLKLHADCLRQQQCPDGKAQRGRGAGRERHGHPDPAKDGRVPGRLQLRVPERLLRLLQPRQRGLHHPERGWSEGGQGQLAHRRADSWLRRQERPDRVQPGRQLVGGREPQVALPAPEGERAHRPVRLE
jgi:PKD repeat protein